MIYTMNNIKIWNPGQETKTSQVSNMEREAYGGNGGELLFWKVTRLDQKLNTPHAGNPTIKASRLPFPPRILPQLILSSNCHPVPCSTTAPHPASY